MSVDLYTSMILVPYLLVKIHHLGSDSDPPDIALKKK